MNTPETRDEAAELLQAQTRAAEADIAMRSAISVLVGRWARADLDANGCFVVERVMRPILMGAVRPLAELAADWGFAGDSAAEIAAGFERTVRLTAELHLAGRKVGWQAEQAKP